jgi:hypothetical protein
VAHVDEEVGDLDDVLEPRPDRNEPGLEVLEALRRLRAEIAGRTGEGATRRLSDTFAARTAISRP